MLTGGVRMLRLRKETVTVLPVVHLTKGPLRSKLTTRPRAPSSDSSTRFPAEFFLHSTGYLVGGWSWCSIGTRNQTRNHSCFWMWLPGWHPGSCRPCQRNENTPLNDITLNSWSSKLELRPSTLARMKLQQISVNFRALYFNTILDALRTLVWFNWSPFDAQQHLSGPPCHRGVPCTKGFGRLNCWNPLEC